MSGDRFLLLEGMESLPLPMIPEFVGATAGYRWHTLSVQLRVYGDPRKSAIHNVSTVYPHCRIGDKIACSNREGQLSLSIATVLDIPVPVNPVVVNWKPKGKAIAKPGVQLRLPISGIEAKLFALRQQTRPHLPPVSSQELLAEKVATWNAQEKREVELPQMILDLLLAQSATDDEWQSAIDLFGVIGLAATINFIEALPLFRQHFNRAASTAMASAQVKASASSSIFTNQQVSVKNS